MNIDISKIKGIIFDYGGTLDTGGDHWSEVIRDAYRKADVAVDTAIFREAYVEAERELARTRHILPEHDFNDVLQIKIRLELQWLSENGHFPPAQVENKAREIAGLCYQAAKANVAEAAPVLEELSKHYALILVSNFYGNIGSVLKDFRIGGYFRDIVESAVVGVRKPDPEIFNIGIKKLRLSPEEVLVVGDSYRKDILPAESLGCQVLWIKGKGWSEEEDRQTHPNIISGIAELPAILNIG